MSSGSKSGPGTKTIVVVCVVVILLLIGAFFWRGQTPPPPSPLPTEEITVAAMPETEPEQPTVVEPEPEPEIVEPEPAPEPEPVEPEPEAPAPPSFDVVRVDAEGNALVAGRAASSAAVEVLIDEVLAAEASADAGGSFVALFSVAPSEVPRVVSLAMTLGSGERIVSDETYILGPTAAPPTPIAEAEPEPEAPVDVAAVDEPEPEPAEPAAPTILKADEDGITVVQGSEDQPQIMDNVLVDTITYDTQGEVLLAGRAPNEGSVRIYLDNEPVRTAPVRPDGQWRVDLPEVDTGVYTLRVDQVDASGNVTSRVETPFLREDREALAALDSDADPERRARLVTVQPGNTLWEIAERRYGSGFLYIRVFEANRDSIRDPDLIYPGQIFDLPQE